MVAFKRPLVKICGITNLQDALSAVEAGCDAVGFIFYRKSLRYIAPAKAASIISSLPGKILKVGVFVDAKPGFILRTAEKCGLDAAQLHGRETPEYCLALKGMRLIKAFGIKSPPDAALLNKFKVWAFLFDSCSPRAKGGTGKVFDWEMLSGLKTKRKVFLSGGLRADNVARAIAKVRPDWVDASSLLESFPGKKDKRKVSEFIAAARGKNRSGRHK